MNGYFNIDKPAGMSSAAVVAVIRRLTGEKRVGHAGTLDPDAAGVLPVMIGKATRLFEYLADKEKEYTAVVAFGSSTDTQDASGSVLETGTDYPDSGRVRREAEKLQGDIVQVPSMYSAIKVGGKPLYARARRGETVDVPERTVHIGRIELLGEALDHGMVIHVVCGRGTYIRTLCHDLGRLCGCPAHMRQLTRTRSGFFTLESGISLEEARALAAEDRLRERLLPPEAPLGHLFRVDIRPAYAKAVANGAKLPLNAAACGEIPEHVPLRVFLEDRFWGIQIRSGQQLEWKALIAPEHDSLPGQNDRRELPFKEVERTAEP